MSTPADSYIERSPSNHHQDLYKLKKMIEDHLTAYKIIDTNMFPVYTKNDEWVSGFASRSKGVMFYLMDTHILDTYENRFGKLRTGKSCLLYKETKDLSIEEFDSLIVKMLQEANNIQRG